MRENSTNKQKRIIKKYNSSAPFYERRYKKIQYNKYLQIFSEIELIGKIILDAGCGTGLIAEFLLENKDRKDVCPFAWVGVDISNNMLKEFREKNEQLGLLSHKMNLVQADIEHLPLRSNRFNTLISITSYQNVPNIKQGVKESIRASKDGAEAYISVLKKTVKKSEFLSLIKPIIDDIKIIDNQSIEDLLIKGTINISSIL